VTSLLGDLRELIESSRRLVAATVASESVLLYWRVGRRIRVDLLHEERAGYGQQIVSTVSRELTAEYGRGFSRPNLHRMLKLAELYPDEEIVAALAAHLNWSKCVELLQVKDELAREFYAEMCRLEGWDVRTLRSKVGGMMYERTALSKRPDELIRRELAELREQDRITPDLVFRDPYFLDFLGLKDTYSERDLEMAILRELESFILELGTDFSFLARQKRIVIGGEDYYIDLLFFHRGLRRLIVIELKLDRFRAADKGQVELYLRWLDRYERREGEESPLGLILCAGKDQQLVELLELETSGIHVSEYLAELPPRELLERKLHDAIRLARERHAPLLLEGEEGTGQEG
jgi:predicted nuclease of restriction endonuclease-like (RecB) superfamily